MARTKGSLNKRSLIATDEMETLKIRPLQMLKDAYDEAMKDGDWASAVSAAGKLAGMRYPQLAAIAIKDLGKQDEDVKPMTTLEAIEVIKKDPFADPSINRGLLPVGEGNAKTKSNT